MCACGNNFLSWVWDRANIHSLSFLGGLCYYFCHPSYNTLPPIFLSSPLFVSPLPPSLSVHLNYSPCRHHPILPPLLPPSRQSPLTLSPSLMPFLLALSLLKPVKGYQALLSISGNSIKVRPYERLFFFYHPNGPWLLPPSQNSFKRRRERSGEMDRSIRSSSLSRSPPLKGNLSTLMDTFVWMYEGWADDGVCK